MPFRLQLTRRTTAAALAAILALLCVVSLREVVLDRIGDAVTGLSSASPAQLWLALLAFGSVVVATGCAWRAGVRACGGSIGVFDASARYAVGSLANSLAPGGCGGPVRIALYARALPVAETCDRVWTSTGVATAISAARAPGLALLVVAAAAIAGFPLWPLLVLGGAMAAAVGVALVARRRTPRAHVAHVLDAFRALARSPHTAGSLVGWVTAAMGLRVAAAATIAAAFDVSSPLAAAVVMIPALALSSLVPLTPGNIGVGSGAIAVALHMVGVDGGTAIAIGIAFQGLETGIGVLSGVLGLLALAAPPVPAWSVRLAGSVGCLGLAAAFGATVLV